MTEAEKAAEVKAAADKLAAEKKTGSKEETKEEDDVEGEEDDDEGGDSKAEISRLKTESKKHRLAAKTAKAELAAANAEKDRVIAALGNKGEQNKPDPVAEIKKSSDAKMRNAFLKAAVAANVGADAHDPAAVYLLASKKLGDVEVDLDTEEVDGDALSEVLDEMREKQPFLFKKAEAAEGGEEKKPTTNKVRTGKLPPDAGHGTRGANHYQQYQQLVQQNRAGEAQAYYQANRAAILVQMKADPKLG